MKLVYVCRARIPGRKAHVTQIHKMCDALQQEVSVELLHPAEPRDDPDPAALKEFYHLRECLHYRTLPCINITWLRNSTRRVGFYLYAFSYLVMVLVVLLLGSSAANRVVYSRDRIVSLVLSLLSPLHSLPVFTELHDIPGTIDSPLVALWKKHAGLVVISKRLKKDLVDFGFEPRNIHVAPDGVDLRQFSFTESRDSLRRRLGLPTDRPIVGYTGHLYPYKGPRVILRLAEAMPSVNFVTVGGLDHHLARFREQISTRDLDNLTAVEFQPHSRIPEYLKSFDVLLLPLTTKRSQQNKYSSPLKLFEYLAAQRPIVASDLPALREILTDGRDALLADPQNPADFRARIETLLASPSRAQTLAQNARNLSEDYSWDTRARNVLSFVRERTDGGGPRKV